MFLSGKLQQIITIMTRKITINSWAIRILSPWISFWKNLMYFMALLPEESIWLSLVSILISYSFCFVISRAVACASSSAWPSFLPILSRAFLDSSYIFRPPASSCSMLASSMSSLCISRSFTLLLKTPDMIWLSSESLTFLFLRPFFPFFFLET